MNKARRKTIDELREQLEALRDAIEAVKDEEDDETEIYLKNDNGYTYGSITRTSFELVEDEDPEDDSDEEDDDGEAEDFLKKYINKEDA